MFTRNICVLVALALLANPVASLASKPADLPLDLTGKCTNESREDPQSRMSFYFCDDESNSEEDDLVLGCCPYLDALPPAMLAMLDELRREGTALAQGDAACDPHWLAQARHLYLIAQQCRTTGDLAMAKNCLRQVELICPQSTYAELARQDLSELTSERRPAAPVIVLVKRTRPLQVEVECECPRAEQSPGEWWQERFLKACREIRAYRAEIDRERQRDVGFSEEQEDPPPPSREQQRLDQLLRSTVPLETHLDELQESPPDGNGDGNGMVRGFTRALDLDVQPNRIRAAVSFGGRLYRVALEW